MERRNLHKLCLFSKQYLEAGTLAIKQAYSQVCCRSVSPSTGLICGNILLYLYHRNEKAPTAFFTNAFGSSTQAQG